MNLRKRILLGYGVALVLVAMVIIWTVVNLLSLGRASGSILNENYKSILAAQNMLEAIDRQDKTILTGLLYGFEASQLKFRSDESLFLQSLGRARENVTIEGEAEIVNSIERQYLGFLAKYYEMRNESQSSGHLADIYKQSLFSVSDSIHVAIHNLRELNQKTMYNSSLQASIFSGRVIWSTIVIGTLSLVLGLAFSLFLSNRIVQPLYRMMEAARTIARGVYRVQLPTEGMDEFGQLAREFNQMAGELASFHELNVEKIVTEKQKVEAILKSIEDGIVVINPDMTIAIMNPSAARLLDLAEIVLGAPRHLREVLDNEELYKVIQTLADTGKLPSLEEEKRIVPIAGKRSRRDVLFSVTPVRAKDGALSAIVILLRDVTRLRELDRLKSEFVMAASHELRTPLTSIGMSIDLLMEHISAKLEPRERELLVAAQEEIKRLKSLVSDLLDLSRIEAGKIELDFQRVQVGSFIERVMSYLINQIEEKMVNIAVEIPEGIPEVRADANKIIWVITNLVANALRYVSQGGNVRLSAHALGAFVHFSVSDDGPGIPQEYQAKIFEKFVQVKGVGPTGGTGLGLAICKEIVRAHGGTIWVDSSPGHGSTFTFTLPIVEK